MTQEEATVGVETLDTGKSSTGLCYRFDVGRLLTEEGV